MQPHSNACGTGGGPGEKSRLFFPRAAFGSFRRVERNSVTLSYCMGKCTAPYRFFQLPAFSLTRYAGAPSRREPLAHPCDWAVPPAGDSFRRLRRHLPQGGRLCASMQLVCPARWETPSVIPLKRMPLLSGGRLCASPRSSFSSTPPLPVAPKALCVVYSHIRRIDPI